MEPISLDEVRERQSETGDRYVEFLREATVSLGRYVLSTGESDPQTPHHEDEVYLVLDGRADIRIGDETYPVESGDVVFVERLTEHRFVDIEESLELLVVFAPPEGAPEAED